MKETVDLSIIGAGPTGLFAAFYAGLRHMRVRIFDTLPEPGGQLTVLYPEKYVYDVPGFPRIRARDLVKALKEQADAYQPEYHLDEQVLRLEPSEEGYRLHTAKDVYPTRAVLIAVGIGSFTPNTLDRPGIKEYEGRGVLYFVRSMDELRDHRVLVVGGGDSAVDWALGLVGMAREVTLIHRRQGFRAHEGSVKALFESPVRVKLHYELKEVRGNGDRVTQAVIFQNQTGEEETLDVDTVILALGFKANLGPVAEWGLELEGRHIKVNARMETNLPGVYAAGDAVAQEGLGNLKLMVVGFGQAAIAVNAAATYLNPQARLFPGHSSNQG